MEPLYNLKNKFKIDLIHENTLYKFSISDIMRIARCNLLNHSDLFIEPTMPKNPYNNVNFSRGNIYTIYLHLIMNGFTIPKIFNRFIHADVSLKRFHRENETFLLNKAISEYHMDMSEPVTAGKAQYGYLEGDSPELIGKEVWFHTNRHNIIHNKLSLIHI